MNAAAIMIPLDQLSTEALHGLLEEIVTRDGTELSESQSKIARVEDLLRRGQAELWFDRATRTCSIERT